ncbi:hypothetical protein F4814DRAFT_428879 [Daldinia grandis]|nr:hypothetical protein F4814DRAFT_428879 [Daldinia grandis]
MESKTSRYQSRILREMHQNTENPFNSPPSSTGSHGTITLTSNITVPQAESTRRMDDLSIDLPSQAAMRSAKAPQPSSLNINTSVLGRTFPEWSRWNPNGLEDEKDMWETASDDNPVSKEKENLTPLGSPNSSVAATPRAEESGRNKVSVTKATNTAKDRVAATEQGPSRSRAQMQPRVEDGSECSFDFPKPVRQPRQDLQEQGNRPQSSVSNTAKKSKPRRGNVTALLETLKTAQTKQAESKEQPSKQVSPKSQLSQLQHAAGANAERQPGGDHMARPTTPNQTARSFFIPNLSYMNDFLSGALKLSSLRNGIPIFVKHGKVHDRESMIYSDHHADIEALSIPEDEEKIFVSLDKIKDEIHALREHDELVSKQAEQLQEEVEDMHVQIAKYKSRKDSAMGSDSESSIIDHLSAQKNQLEEQVSSLQARLDKANRKISINEIHTESYVAERDEALKTSTEYSDKIKQLQSELSIARRQFKSLHDDNSQDGNTLEVENRSLRKDNSSIRQKWKSLLEENQSLREYNADVSQQNGLLEQELKGTKAELEALRREHQLLSEEKDMLKQDNLSLERHNDEFFNDNKILKQQNSLLDRRTHELEDNVARLRKLLDASNAETGEVSVDFKDIKYRLEVQNRELSKENAELQQQIIDLEADFASKRVALEQEKRRLGRANARYKEQLNQIGERFEQIVKESKEEAAMYEEQQTALTQQLELIADKESALANKLKKSAVQEAKLQSELDRRTDAINEARQITQEIKDFMSTVSKKQQHAKTARAAESKGKSAVSETTARSTTSQTDIPMQDDYTQQIDLTQGSDFASIFTQGEMPKLRDALRQVRNDTRPEDSSDDESFFDDDDISEPATPSLPRLFVPNSRPRSINSQKIVSGTSKARTETGKSQPVGILKESQPSRLNSQKLKTNRTATETGSEDAYKRNKTTDSATGVRKSKLDDTNPRKVSFGQPAMQDDLMKPHTEHVAKETRSVPEPDLTGRFSVKSGMSIPSQVSEMDKLHRRNSDSARFDIDIDSDSDHEDNMTSALFIDDITLGQRKMAEKQNTNIAKNELSKDAKRVLDNLCHDHDCGNCIVCSRINSRGSGQRPIRAKKPIPVTDRVAEKQECEDQCTMRPSQDPAMALAKVIRSLEDEEQHLKEAFQKRAVEFDRCDPSINRKTWKRLGFEIDKIRKVRDLKRDQIYYLYDALEGQKASGQEMTSEFVEYTIHGAMSKDHSWNGVLGI